MSIKLPRFVPARIVLLVLATLTTSEPAGSATYSSAVAPEFTASIWAAVPRAVNPVPPLAIGSVPVTLVVRLAKVVDVVPVPPLAIGSVPVTWLALTSPVSNTPPVLTVSASVLALLIL
jgi:hypothetical protein